MAEVPSSQPLARVAGLPAALAAASATSATADAMQTGDAGAGNGSPGGGETPGIHCSILSRDTRYLASARRRGGRCRGRGGRAGPHPAQRWRCLRSAVSRQRQPAVQVDSAASRIGNPGSILRRQRGVVASRGRGRQSRRDAVAGLSTQRRAVGLPQVLAVAVAIAIERAARRGRAGRVDPPGRSVQPPEQTPYVVCVLADSWSVPSRYPGAGRQAGHQSTARHPGQGRSQPVQGPSIGRATGGLLSCWRQARPSGPLGR
jgi:hypothetical protein